jgi:hypothetical protein
MTCDLDPVKMAPGQVTAGRLAFLRAGARADEVGTPIAGTMTQRQRASLKKGECRRCRRAERSAKRPSDRLKMATYSNRIAVAGREHAHRDTTHRVARAAAPSCTTRGSGLQGRRQDRFLSADSFGAGQIRLKYWVEVVGVKSGS